MSELDTILLSMALASVGICIACFLSARDVTAKNAKLQAENAKLRERDGNLFNAIFAKNNELIDVLCENEKLRELARMLANCAAGHGCDYCPINGGHGYVGEMDMCESVHDRMRELGVIE